MSFFKKWYTYQKERFPVLIYGLYVFAIVFAVFCFNSHLILTYETIINWKLLIPMFVVTFLQFLMVRIVDEFKDYEEDCKYRSYRPVPRGLITLKELKILFVICILLQLAITFFATEKIISFTRLGILWMFFVVMSKSFFMKKIIEKHILFEVALDELMMPILVWYLSSFLKYINPTYSLYSYIDMQSMLPLLCMSYIVSWIVEIARKIRCREDEEKGVKTYTAVFGIKKAMLILFVLETILMIIQLSILKGYILPIICLYLAVNLINLRFVAKQNRKFAKLTELSANIYVFIVYFSMILLII